MFVNKQQIVSDQTNCNQTPPRQQLAPQAMQGGVQLLDSNNAEETHQRSRLSNKRPRYLLNPLQSETTGTLSHDENCFFDTDDLYQENDYTAYYPTGYTSDSSQSPIKQITELIDKNTAGGANHEDTVSIFTNVDDDQTNKLFQFHGDGTNNDNSKEYSGHPPQSPGPQVNELTNQSTAAAHPQPAAAGVIHEDAVDISYRNRTPPRQQRAPQAMQGGVRLRQSALTPTPLNHESVRLHAKNHDATQHSHATDWAATDLIKAHLPHGTYKEFLSFIGNSERTPLTLKIFQEPRRLNCWRFGWGNVNTKSSLRETTLTEDQLNLLKKALSQSFSDIINIIEPLRRTSKTLATNTNIISQNSDEINKYYHLSDSSKFAEDDLCFDRKLNEVKVNFFNNTLNEVINSRNKTTKLLKDISSGNDFDLLEYRSDKVFHVLASMCVTEILPDLKLRLDTLSTIDEVNAGWKEMQNVAKNAIEQPAKVETVIKGAPLAFRGSNWTMSKHFSFGNINALKGILQTGEPCGKGSVVSMESILDRIIEQDDLAQNTFLRAVAKRFGAILFDISKISGKAEGKTPFEHFRYIVKENFSHVSEYPANQSIADTVALMNELYHGNPDYNNPDGFINIYDPCIGWGNRAYAVLAINAVNNGQRQKIKLTGNDPNSGLINILPYLERVSKDLQLSEDRSITNNDLLSHINIGDEKIGDTFKRCLAGNTESEDIGKVDIFRSSPPFADTLSFPRGKITEYNNKFGLQKKQHSARLQYEEYPGTELMDADAFATEFVYKLVTLGAMKLRNGGKFSMAFNRNHAMVLSSYLVNSVHFDNVRLSAQTTYKGKGITKLEGPSHVYVIATRTSHEAPRLSVYDFKDDLAAARNPETYIGFLNEKKISLHYSKPDEKLQNDSKARKRKSEEI